MELKQINAVKAFLALPVEQRNKTKAAADAGTNPRTFGRWIEKYQSGAAVAESVSTKTGKKPEKTTPESVKAEEPKLSVISWFVTKSALAMTLSDGNQLSVPKDSENFQAVVDALLKEDYSHAIALSNKKHAFELLFGKVEVKGGNVLYKGKRLSTDIAAVIMERAKAGDEKSATKYAKFLANLMENPSYKSVQQLHPFLKHNDLVIDDDGYVECWKVVRANYTDCHTGKFDNSVGKVVSMERNEVEDDPNKTCSAGLHVCAKGYIPAFISGGNRAMKVRVHPRDFVSIPTDYNGAKSRTCRYEVLADVTDSKEWKN